MHDKHDHLNISESAPESKVASAMSLASAAILELDRVILARTWAISWIDCVLLLLLLLLPVVPRIDDWSCKHSDIKFLNISLHFFRDWKHNSNTKPIYGTWNKTNTKCKRRYHHSILSLITTMAPVQQPLIFVPNLQFLILHLPVLQPRPKPWAKSKIHENKIINQLVSK